jgi:hypothetical protein
MVERVKFTTTLDKELLKKARMKQISMEIKNLNEVIEELLRKWV